MFRGKLFLECRRIGEYISLELFFSVLGEKLEATQQKMLFMFQCRRHAIENVDHVSV